MSLLPCCAAHLWASWHLPAFTRSPTAAPSGTQQGRAGYTLVGARPDRHTWSEYSTGTARHCRFADEETKVREKKAACPVAQLGGQSRDSHLGATRAPSECPPSPAPGEQALRGAGSPPPLHQTSPDSETSARAHRRCQTGPHVGLLTVQDRPCPSRRGESGSDLSTTPALVEATSCLHFCPRPQGPGDGPFCRLAWSSPSY